jgi:hypothetical protein
MLHPESVAVGKIGRAVVVTSIWATVWGGAGVLTALFSWLGLGLNGDPDRSRIPLSVFLNLYPGVGIIFGATLGLIFAIVLIVWKSHAKQHLQRIKSRSAHIALVGSLVVGIYVGAPMIAGTVSSYIVGISTLGVIAAAGGAAAKLSAPWVLQGAGT